MNSKNKNFFFLLFIPFLLIAVGFFINPFAPFNLDDENIYITGGDIIKNFRFESFDGFACSEGGTTTEYGDRLKLESGSVWKASKDDVDLQYAHQVEETVYLYYKVSMSNKINIYTNVKLDQASEKPLRASTEEFLAGKYAHYGLFGDFFYGWESNLKWTHYDFGDIRHHNYQNNYFSGDIVMSFDIASSPLPEIFQDAEGKDVIKEFDYIAISSVFVGTQSVGKLSNDMPTIVGLTPAEYDTSRNTVSGGETEGTTNGFDYKWNPDPQLKVSSTPSNTFDSGIQPQSSGSSLNPTTKSGSPIWDARDKESSMTNCKFTYNLGSISPLVSEYSATLTYYEQTLHTQDTMIALLPLVIEPRVVLDKNIAMSETRPVALHVTNRYVQTELKVVFNVWTSYKLEALESDNYDDLENPEEYYDEIIWNTIVDGFGGGEVYTEGIVSWVIFQILMIVGIIILVVVVLYLLIKKGIPKLIKKIF